VLAAGLVTLAVTVLAVLAMTPAASAADATVSSTRLAARAAGAWPLAGLTEAVPFVAGFPAADPASQGA